MSNEYTPAEQAPARKNIERINDYLKTAKREGLLELATILQETAKDPTFHTPLTGDEIKTICRLGFCYLFQWLYPTPGDPMKIYKFQGGPKDGEEIKTTNAPHPRSLMFATENAYVEYTMYIENFDGTNTTITYSLTKTEPRNR